MEKKVLMTREEFKHFETVDVMYDEYMSVVKGFNRLVDICNDSAERMAEFMAKDDINEFKKELQSKAPGEFKIQKLADIVVWADSLIERIKPVLIELGEFEVNNDVKQLKAVKKVVLESINRHNTYTNALNMDIADKAAKIDLLEKEIEGRKKAFNDLSEEMANRYITIETHNGICKSYEDRIEYLNEEYKKKIKEIEENKSLKKQVEYLTKELNNSYKAWDTDSKNHQKRDMTLVDELGKKNDEIKKLNEENSRLNARIKCDTEYWKEAFETQSTSLAEVRKLNDELVDTLNKSSDRIDELEEEVTQYKELIDGLNKDLTYWKDQERIRTDQLRATESKVEELWKRIEGLKRANRIAVNSVYGIASASVHKVEDDHGRAGFKKYIEWLIEEEERAVPERFKARLNEEITEIFEKEEETEETEVKDIPCGEDSIE